MDTSIVINSKEENDNRAIGIACRLDSPEALEVVQLITDILLARKEKIFFETRIATKFIRHFAKNLGDMSMNNTKFIISVGGDGTVLRVAQNLPKKNPPPILGVNLGSVGFLDESEKTTLDEDLKNIFEGNYKLEECARLSTYVGNKKLPDALNEVLIISSKPSKVLYTSIGIDDAHFTSSYLDGLIISTHTGSTAYALSAGGILMDPRLDAFEIVPLNPFAGTGAFRPLLIPTSAKIDVKLERPRLNGLIVIDGQAEYRVSPQINIRIQRAESNIYFIRFKEGIHDAYFERVRNKILFSRKLSDNSPET